MTVSPEVEELVKRTMLTGNDHSPPDLTHPIPLEVAYEAW